MCMHADRWLTPGAEYAVPKKLPLPREWYKGWDLTSSSANQEAATGLTEADMGNSESQTLCASFYWLFSWIPQSWLQCPWSASIQSSVTGLTEAVSPTFPHFQKSM